MTFRKSRGAKRSVGVTMSVLPQRMNCLPTSSVNRPRVSVAVEPPDRQPRPRAGRDRESRRATRLRPDRASSLEGRGRPANCSQGAGLTNTSSRAQQIADDARGIVRRLLREQHARALDEAALRDRSARAAGDRHAAATQRRTAEALSLPPDRLQREVLVLQRHVVLQLVERQPRAAAARRSVISSCRAVQMPCTFWMSRVVQPADQPVLDVVLDPRERVVVLADPDDRSRVLRRLASASASTESSSTARRRSISSPSSA